MAKRKKYRFRIKSKWMRKTIRQIQTLQRKSSDPSKGKITTKGTIKYLKEHGKEETKAYLKERLLHYQGYVNKYALLAVYEKVNNGFLNLSETYDFYKVQYDYVLNFLSHNKKITEEFFEAMLEIIYHKEMKLPEKLEALYCLIKAARKRK